MTFNNTFFVYLATCFCFWTGVVAYGVDDDIRPILGESFTVSEEEAPYWEFCNSNGFWDAVETGDLEYLKENTEETRNLEKKKEGAYTALELAIMNGHIGVAEFLIERGADVNNSFNLRGGRSPLHLAASFGEAEIVELLVKSGADVSAEDRHGTKPLYIALGEGKSEVVQILLQNGAKLDTDSSEYHGGFLLRTAAAGGLIEIIDKLIEKGVEVDAGYKQGRRTPLAFALERGNVKAAEFLIEKGALLDPQYTYGEHGMTLLHAAARGGAEQFVKQLLEKEADINAQDKYGFSAVHLAARFGHENIVGMLLLADEIDVNIVDQMKKTPLMWALIRGRESIADLLLKNGATMEVGDRDAAGRTYLHHAALGGNIDFIKRLIKNGADSNAADKRGWTPLHCLAAGQTTLGLVIENDFQAPIIQVLIQHGADVNATDSNGRTPLHLVARWGREFLVCSLLSGGADVEAIDNMGRTPLELSNYMGYYNIANLLKGKRAE